MAVISDRLWRERYSASPDIVGRQIRLNGAPYTIVGVMPPRFDFPGNIDVWQRSTWDFRRHSRGAHFMESVARRTPGVTIEQTDAALTALTQRFATEFAATNKGWSARSVPLLDDQLGYYRPALIVLFGAVGLLARDRLPQRRVAAPHARARSRNARWRCAPRWAPHRGT